MKQLIRDVLDEMSEGHINFESEASRELITNTIMAAIKTNNGRRGWVLDLSTLDGGSKLDTPIYEKSEEWKVKESWVCSICGKNTYDVDWDYIGSGTNHLGCELEDEKRKGDRREKKEVLEPRVVDDAGVDIKTGKYVGDPGWPDRDFLGISQREKNWSQEKHEEKVFNQAVFGDSRDLTEAKLDNHQLTNDREYPYNSFVRNKEEADKLAEEIVSDNDTGYIYESPDGGKTVYKRKVGGRERELVKDWKKINVRK